MTYDNELMMCQLEIEELKKRFVRPRRIAGEVCAAASEATAIAKAIKMIRGGGIIQTKIKSRHVGSEDVIIEFWVDVTAEDIEKIALSGVEEDVAAACAEVSNFGTVIDNVGFVGQTPQSETAAPEGGGPSDLQISG